MIRCKNCHEALFDEEVDDENTVCPRCGMPIGYAEDDEEQDEDQSEIDEFFKDDEDDDNIDPDALTQDDLDELLAGQDVDEDVEFDESEFDDDEDSDGFDE